MRHATFAVLAAMASPVCAHVAPAPYTLAGSIPGEDGGWDYATLDADTGIFYVAHGDTIGVLDLAHPDRVRTLGPARHAHAVLPIPGSGELLVTDGDTATARFIDRKSGATRATIALGEKPDAAIWDPWRKQAVVVSARAGIVAFIDPASATVRASVVLTPGLEFAAFDRRGTLFVNDEVLNVVHVIDAAGARAIGTIHLPGCSEPSGLAYAPLANRLVAACANHKAAIIDPVAMTMVASLPSGAEPDAVMSDTTRHRLMIPSGRDGRLTVLADRPNGLFAVGSVATQIEARTGAVDPRTGRVYLPVARLAAPNRDGIRGQAAPGTFHVLVLEPGKMRR